MLDAVNVIGAVEASNTVVLFDIVNVASVDDSPDNVIPVNVACASVVVGHAVDDLLGVVLVSCEVVVVVSDTIMEDEDVSWEARFRVCLVICSVLLGSVDVDVSCSLLEVVALADLDTREVFSGVEIGEEG